MINFEKKDCFAEVVESSSENITLSVWPEHTAEIGELVLLDSTREKVLGVITSLEQKTSLEREPRPLMLSQAEIRSQMPHIESLVSLQAEVATLGTVSKLGLLQTFEIPKIHTFAKKTTLLKLKNSLNTKDVIRPVLEKPINPEAYSRIIIKILQALDPQEMNPELLSWIYIQYKFHTSSDPAKIKLFLDKVEKILVKTVF